MKWFLNSPLGAMQLLSAPLWAMAWLIAGWTIWEFLLAWVIVSVLQVLAYAR